MTQLHTRERIQMNSGGRCAGGEQIPVWGILMRWLETALRKLLLPQSSLNAPMSLSPGCKESVRQVAQKLVARLLNSVPSLAKLEVLRRRMWPFSQMETFEEPREEEIRKAPLAPARWVWQLAGGIWAGYRQLQLHRHKTH
ncbi:MAG TPA: hypothetical protein VEY93_09275 [Longimicrobium sp.]|nr:hypothetical protein [Longimicrobium sp.]